MKRLAIIITMLTFNILMIHAQGYEWEWSPRAPFTMPTRFVGIEVAAQYAQHNGSLTYYQHLIPCCEFTSGTGMPIRLSLVGEQWVLPRLSVQASVGMIYQSASFSVLDTAIPHEQFGEIQTEYLFDASYSQIALSIGARQRLIGFLSIGLDLRGLIGMGSSTTLTERIVRPDDYYFSTNPPSKEYEWDNSVIGDLATIVIEPAVTLQYDIALGLGMVLSPSFTVSMPLTSLSTDQSWTYLAIGGGLRLSRGL